MMAAEATKRPRILVVGQTPPPYGGQVVMIEHMLSAGFQRIELVHVRMAFSRSMAEMGRPALAKCLQLPMLALRIIQKRFASRADVLYYPPAGGDGIGIYRDMALLAIVRPFFRRTIFHFHAAGLSEKYDSLSRAWKLLFRRAYSGADAAIITAVENRPDADKISPMLTVTIPYGIPDPALGLSIRPGGNKKPPMLLYAGVIRESKGVGILADALGELRRKNVGFRACLMGEFVSKEYERELCGRMASLGLNNVVEFPGALAGVSKWERFASASIFCFPTFFESESFGLSIVEAMAFRMPVVATDWRGVRSVVREGKTGFLVPVKDSHALADRLQYLIENPDVAMAMGNAARQIYEREYHFDLFAGRMEDLFARVAGASCRTEQPT